MHKLRDLVCQLKIWNDSRGQDLIEYALMAAFVATAAAAITPQMVVGVSGCSPESARCSALAKGELDGPERLSIRSQTSKK